VKQAIAFVSANEGAIIEESAVRQFLRTKLADYKVPRKVVVLPSLPRNATGKILKDRPSRMAIGWIGSES